MTKFKNLSKAKKVLVVLGVFIVFTMILGATSPDKKEVAITDASKTTPKVQSENTEKKPVVEVKTIWEQAAIPFQVLTQNDPNLEVGKSFLNAAGVNGQKTITYEVTYTDGQETSRKQVGERTDTQPIHQMTNIGTKPKPTPKPAPAAKPKPIASNCNPNYSGCVPNASDVDCSGGSGNGPAYVNGPIRVIGSDVYDLDRDGNGVACE